MEDVLEELVGEIFSEHDTSSELVRQEAEGWAVVDASASIREVNRRLSIALPDDGDWSTLAGLVLALAGRMPAVGQTFRLPNGVELVVADASPRRINAVRVRASTEHPSETDAVSENERS
jgi:putative hemolysin